MNEPVAGGSAPVDRARADAAARLRLVLLRHIATQQPLNELMEFASGNAALEAPSHTQQALEAAVFLALRELRDTGPTLVNRPREFSIRSLRPSPNHLLVDADPESAMTAIAEILPTKHQGEFHGVPGLRVRDGRHGAIVHRLGDAGEIEFAATSVRGIRTVFNKEFSGGEDHSYAWPDPDVLSPRERNALDRDSLTGSAASVASAAARRFGVLAYAGASTITMWRPHPETVTIHLEAWFDEPPTAPERIAELFSLSEYEPVALPIQHPRYPPPLYYPFAIGPALLILRLRWATPEDLEPTDPSRGPTAHAHSLIEVLLSQ